MTHDHAKGPDLRVIDRAIERIKRRDNTFTCFALMNSFFDLYPDSDDSQLYQKQYQEFAGRKVTPKWWNSPLPHIRARVAALKEFRQMCIDAAKENK